MCLLSRRLVLLTFQAPEYLMDDRRGIVRWRIDSGVLVARRGHRGDGYLEIDVRKLDGPPPGMARIHVEVEVANFYPSIAFGISQFVYANTQSRIHVIVTHGFLRSLERLDLEESRVGRLAELTVDDVPDPPPRAAADVSGVAGATRTARRRNGAASRGCGARGRGGRCRCASASRSTPWSPTCEPW